MDPDNENGVQNNTPKQLAYANNGENSAAIDFLINAVKSQDDSIRQVMNITGIILGVYVTVVANNYDRITVPQRTALLEPDVIKITLLSVPAIIWIASLIKAVTALHPTSPSNGLNPLRLRHHIEPVIPENRVTREFLAKLIDKKYRLLVVTTITTLLGLVMLFYGALLSGLHILNVA
jgi:hypothetical protein